MIHIRYTFETNFYWEEAINYKAAIPVDLRKMVFILAQEERGEKTLNTLKLFISN